MVTGTAKLQRTIKKARTRVDRGRDFTPSRATLLEELRWLERSGRAPRLRSMREFAEADVVIPTGRYKGERYSCDWTPWAALWFGQIDSGNWRAHWLTGPSQSGKTLAGVVIPVLYYLFEMVETVVVGLPDMDMARDKWERDFLPAIEASPNLAPLLPTRGRGSRGGKFDSVTFRNGGTLKFMSAGGGEKGRAGFNCRVLIITEAEAFGGTGGTSQEGNKLEQLRARGRQFDQAFIEFGECTLTTKAGITWQQITSGSDSKVGLACPHCEAWVIPARQHVLGWEDADNEVEAEAKTLFHCPDCAEPWSDDQRIEANAHCRLLHRGQTVDSEGLVNGDVPATFTFGMRYRGVHNMFRRSGAFGVDLRRATEAVDTEAAERTLAQFVFGEPYNPPITRLTPLDPKALAQRTTELPKGVVPKAAHCLVMHCDIHTRFGRWMAMAFTADATGYIVAYGAFDIEGATQDLDVALRGALLDFRQLCEKGFPVQGGGMRQPDQVWVDAGWQAPSVYQFCIEANGLRQPWGEHRYRPAVGRGTKQGYTGRYKHPNKRTGDIRVIGEQYCIRRQPDPRIYLVDVNADSWKSWFHRRLVTPLDVPGAMHLYMALESREHGALIEELTSEHEVEEFVAGTGTIRRWVCDRRRNHWLDTAYNCCAAAHFCGARLPGQAREPERKVVTDYFAKLKANRKQG